MTQTVFITGASSGIGRATAVFFQENGWNVVATMRNPEKETELNTLENVAVVACDVTDTNSIKKAIQVAVEKFGKIDTLINNAGYYLIGVFEASTDKEIRQQIETNLLGTIQVTKEVVPLFREQQSGLIINLSSIAGAMAVPLQSMYHATKWGVEGFSESLQYELKQFDIRVKIIQPGVIKTDFFGRSMVVAEKKGLKEYAAYSEKIVDSLSDSGTQGSDPKGVAKTIYRAATDNKKKLRYPTGRSKGIVYLRKILPVRIFQRLVHLTMEG